MASKAFSKSLLFFYLSLSRQLASLLSLHRKDHLKLEKNNVSLRHHLHSKTLVLDVGGGLLRSSPTFPYFMLVALEAGCVLRGLLLLLLYPLLCCLSQEVALQVMVLVSFLGIKEEEFRAGRAVLPKYLLEDVGLEAFEILRKARKKVCVSNMPRVMVEVFLKEYLEVEVVVGRELKVFGGYYTGLMEDESNVESLEKIFGEEELDGGVLGFGSCINSPQHQLFSYCKAIHVATEAEKRNWHALPRERYPKPLVFHDGRMAFRPTPMATLAMFLWLPFGISLSIFRSIVFVFLPFEISLPIGAATGMTNRLLSPPPTTTDDGGKYKLFVCNHRTLLDPVYISGALNKHVGAVTYSISPISETLSPIRTARLTRSKEEDRRRMERLLRQGDLVVCPEGTTCREPYLLRFSPLFMELTDEVVPVAVATRVGMFHGTTASGLKVLDSFYFLMNPWPEYDVEFLRSIPTGSCSSNSRYEVANLVQREIASALRFQCTTLTRKDKYMMLAGNEGIVNSKTKHTS
ncbi:unnamed protein product [Musa acuminata subsp. malaccensis]|uniref:(wild Malaysian banana) hypothetical protein n=1 Tax=Musa acuminata subsp. malaccensis TaxID=214687 RepID=A0A804HML8_MUSAM|nr:PREDICTED: probable glycerol-3-phosphate acyltransferase 2 [Musa acuminata subsp. malaccensis]CAG1860751.1 unnamed protein product [Musa acuminata subsp. malaccensis]